MEPLKVEAAVVSSVSVKKKSDNSTFLLEESKNTSEDLQELSIESEIDSIIIKDSSPKEPTKKIGLDLKISLESSTNLNLLVFLKQEVMQEI